MKKGLAYTIGLVAAGTLGFLGGRFTSDFETRLANHEAQAEKVMPEVKDVAYKEKLPDADTVLRLVDEAGKNAGLEFKLKEAEKTLKETTARAEMAENRLQLIGQMPRDIPAGVAEQLAENVTDVFDNGTFYLKGKDGSIKSYAPGLSLPLMALSGHNKLNPKDWKKADLTEKLKKGLDFENQGRNYRVQVFRTSWAPVDISIFDTETGERVGTSINLGHVYDFNVINYEGQPLGVVLAIDNFAQRAPDDLQKQFFGRENFKTARELAALNLVGKKDEQGNLPEAGKYAPVDQYGLVLTVFPLLGDGHVGSLPELARYIKSGNVTLAEHLAGIAVDTEYGIDKIHPWHPKTQILNSLSPIEVGSKIRNVVQTANGLEVDIEVFGNQLTGPYAEFANANSFTVNDVKNTVTISNADLEARFKDYKPVILGK